MRTDDKWLKQIKDQVESYEEPAPSFAWDKISTSLANAQNQSSKKIIPFYRKASTWVAAAALLIGVFSFMLLGEREKVEVQKVYVAKDNYATEVLNKVHADKESSTAFGSTNTLNVNSISELSIQSNQPKLMAIQTDIKTSPQKASLISSRESISNQTFLKEEDVVQTSKEEPTDIFQEEIISEPIQAQATTKTRVYDDLYAHLKQEKSTRNEDNISGLGVHLGGSGGLFNKESGVELQTSYREASLDYFSSPQTILSQKNQQIFLRDGVPYIVDQEITKDYKHRQPISFGLSYSYSLTERVALESGLVYTFISSEVTEVMKGKSYKQKFNYLGVPLKVNWSFFNRNNLSLYAAAGGMIEIAIAGKIDGKSERPTRPQFSTQAGIGLMYKVADHVGLYIEPGASYYFNDGGKYETIRSEKPFNFNLNAGLRFTF